MLLLHFTLFFFQKLQGAMKQGGSTTGKLLDEGLQAAHILLLSKVTNSFWKTTSCVCDMK